MKALKFTIPTLLGLTLAAAAWGQTTTGSIAGSVSDPSGAVITNAKVEIISQNTGAVNMLTSNESGFFKAAFVIPGKYTVKVSSPGFRTYEQKDLEVDLSRESVVNAKLEVGQVGDTVEVEAAAPLIESDTSQLSLNVDSKKIVTLPGVQGAIDRLALLSPGVVYGFGNINSNGLVFSANGQRARSNNFLLDGQDNNDPTIGGPGYFFSDVEALGEFQVITNQFSAEYGRNSGAIVNLRVKSGTNQYHGTGSYLRRDDHNWTALDNFQRANGLTTPPKYFDSTLSGQFDGPIIKDKLFFNGWLQREWTRQNYTYIGTASALTPTPAGLATLQQAFPNSITVQNMAKFGAWGNKLGNPTIVASTVTTKPLLDPNGNTVNVEFSAIQRAVAQTGDNWDGGVKADYVLSSKDTITGKWYQQQNTFANAASNAGAGYFYNNPGKSKQLGGSWVRIIDPTTTNEFRFSFIKTGFYFEGGNTYPFSSISKNIANVSISTGGFLGYGLATNLPQYREVNTYQFQDNLSKIIGRHSLRFGTQINKDNIPLGFLPAINGQYIFPSFQAYVNNTPSQFNGAAGTATQEPKEVDQAYYVQDDFKLRPNLTLNLGLRYEYSGQPINLLNQITTARESNPATAIWNQSLSLADRTYPKLPAPSKNFAPRVGFAYSPSGSGDGMMARLFGKDSTVIRGGFSVSYDPAFYNLMLNAQTAAPVVYSYSLTGASVVPMPSDISGGNLQTLFAPPKGVDPRTLNQTLFDPNFRDPYSLNMSLGVQRRVGRNSGFEIRGVRTRAVAQFASRNGNPLISGYLNNGFANVVPAGDVPTTSSTCSNCNGRVIPNYSNIRVRDNSGQAAYNGLQTSFNTRNIFNQVTLGLTYTWSKTMDNVSEAYSFLGSGSVLTAQDPFNVTSGERALSNNNIPHAMSFNMSWDVPLWRKSDKFYGKILGGWTVGMFDIWQAGRPMTPVQSSTTANVLADSSYDGFAAGYGSMRPFLINPTAPMSSVATITSAGVVNLANTSQQVSLGSVHWLYNTLAADKLIGTPFGVGRNTLTGPVFQRADLSIFKNFAITERIKLQLRGEATNAFNHVAYLIPNLYVDSGTATTFLNPTTTEAVPRVIKLGARIQF